MSPAGDFVRMAVRYARKVAPSKRIKTRFGGNVFAFPFAFGTIDKCPRPWRQQIVCGYSATTALWSHKGA